KRVFRLRGVSRRGGHVAEFYPLLPPVAHYRSVTRHSGGSVPKRAIMIGVAMAGLFVHGRLALAQSRPTGGVAGRVSDSTGARLANVAIVIAAGAESAPQATSDDSGSFRLRDVDPGRVRVIARRLGYEPETLTVIVSAGVD